MKSKKIKPYLHLRYLLLPFVPFAAFIMALSYVSRSFVNEIFGDFIASYKWWVCALFGETIHPNIGWYRLWSNNGGCGPWTWFWKKPRNPKGAKWSKYIEETDWPVR